MCAELDRRDRYWVVRIDLLDLIDPNDARDSDVWLAVAQQLVARLQADGLPIPAPVLSRLENWFSEQVLSHEQVKELGLAHAHSIAVLLLKMPQPRATEAERLLARALAVARLAGRADAVAVIAELLAQVQRRAGGTSPSGAADV